MIPLDIHDLLQWVVDSVAHRRTSLCAVLYVFVFAECVPLAGIGGFLIWLCRVVGQMYFDPNSGVGVSVCERGNCCGTGPTREHTYWSSFTPDVQSYMAQQNHYFQLSFFLSFYSALMEECFEKCIITHLKQYQSFCYIHVCILK